MKEALVAVFLTRCLQSKGYFDFKENLWPEFNVDELRIALWIHRFMRIARFNCHAIREVKKPTGKVRQLILAKRCEKVNEFKFPAKFHR